MKRTRNLYKDTNCSCGNLIKLLDDCFSVSVPKKDILFKAIEMGIVTTEKYICKSCGLGIARQTKEKYFQLDIFGGGK